MRVWSGWLRGLGIGVVASLSLAACGDNNDDAAAPVAEPERNVEAASSNPEAAPAPEPFSEPVAISASAEPLPDRRLRVSGETNLPDDAVLLIIVERRASGVRWRHRTSVSDGRFSAEPFGPGSGLPDGTYTITVSLQPASVQPQAVQARIGDRGQHLSGPLVYESVHQGTTAEYSITYTMGG
ncbi:hypothetical protein [Litchfieldella rifensis]|uniref:Lipoprotein n=1 Tax=Litchfieldella rifensis TaxID=762643 RepID=A0ABV7LIM5_9GAMM